MKGVFVYHICRIFHFNIVAIFFCSLTRSRFAFFLILFAFFYFQRSAKMAKSTKEQVVLSLFLIPGLVSSQDLTVHMYFKIKKNYHFTLLRVFHISVS